MVVFSATPGQLIGWRLEVGTFYRLFNKEVCLSNVFGLVRHGTLKKHPRGVLYLLNAHDNLQKAHLVTFGSCANIQQRFQPTKGCAQQSLIGVFS